MGHEVSQFAPLDPDLEAENDLVHLIPILLEGAITHPEPQPQSTSILTGRLRVEELLAGNVHTFRTVARMDKQTFSRLVNLMRGAGLDDTPHISVEEKLLIHIQVCCGKSNRELGYMFQHSGDTISKIVREVVIQMRSVSHLFFMVPEENSPVPKKIRTNPKFGTGLSFQLLFLEPMLLEAPFGTARETSRRMYWESVTLT
jgi:hypothetical protein